MMFMFAGWQAEMLRRERRCSFSLANNAKRRASFALTHTADNRRRASIGERRTSGIMSVSITVGKIEVRIRAGDQTCSLHFIAYTFSYTV